MLTNVGIHHIETINIISPIAIGPTMNGTIDFINGSKMFLNDSIYNHSPKVGDVLLFPNYLMHTAYPFSTKGERRSFSFNVEIDKKIANIFSS